MYQHAAALLENISFLGMVFLRLIVSCEMFNIGMSRGQTQKVINSSAKDENCLPLDEVSSAKSLQASIPDSKVNPTLVNRSDSLLVVPKQDKIDHPGQHD